jgi:regulation of enolase protein 1 (concanavalin A-like superfamily)
MTNYLRICLLACLAGGLFWTLNTRSQLSPPQATTTNSLVLKTNVDIGRVKLAGQTVRTGGRRDIEGNGFGVIGTEDSLQFDYRPLFGDGQVIGRVILNTPSNGLARAGIMIRESLAMDATCAAISVTPTNGLSFQWRERSGEPSWNEMIRPGRLAVTNQFLKLLPSRSWEFGGANFVPRITNAFSMAGKPVWLKLERKGAVIAAYHSPNGTNWTWVTSQEIPMTWRVFVGLAVSSHNFNKLASARSGVFRVEPLAETAQTAPVVGNGTGLRGFYFPTTSTNRVIRTAPTLDLRWGQKPQLPQLKKGEFTARWVGDLEAQHGELYSLSLQSRGAVRMWLNGRKVIDHWHAPPNGELKVNARLQAGTRYRVKVEYLDNGDRAECRLLWSSPSTPKQVIPRSQWYLTSDPQGETPAVSASLDTGTLTGSHAFPSARDVGGSRVPGQTVVTGSGYTVDGSGADIGGNADAFHFVYQPWSGDGEIIAKIARGTDGSHGAKAGVMVRQSLAADSANVSLTFGHVKGLQFEERRKASEGTFLVDKAPPGDSWLKLVRRRSIFTAFSSTDGTNWIWRGKTEVTMSSNVFIGLAVCSKRPTETYRAHFSEVVLRPPPPGSGRKIVGTGDGLGAVYFDQATSNIVQRIDPAINFAWGRHFPAERIGRGDFSVRWQGLLEAQLSEPYELHFISDGGVRVWLDGKVILDDWSQHSRRERKVRLELKAGHRYALQVEYYARVNGFIRMLWSGPGTPKKPIPQSQLYSPAHPAYGEIPDKDHDGLPDSWEQLHNLNDTDASDAAVDSDQDGLTNLQEFQAGTNPRNRDTDGDGLWDGWEVQHGLNPLKAASAMQDSDRDGLTDLDEFKAGTNPFSNDSDGDGLSDWLEVKETRTNPLLSNTTGVSTVLEADGSAAVAQLGQWSVEGASIQSVDGRGHVEYEFITTADNMYRLEVEGRSANPYDHRTDYELQLWVDDEYLGRTILQASADSAGVIHGYTPFLRAGAHRVRIFWDNAVWNRALRLDKVRLQFIAGPDTDGNGVTDWVDARLRNTCTVDVAPEFSRVSPACIEGRGAYVSMMSIAGTTEPRRGINDGWFADVPLSATNQTRVVCTFQNGGLKTTNHIAWRPSNLLIVDDTTVRSGDSLLLVARPTGTLTGQMQVAIAGVTNYSGPANQPFAHQFPTAGTYTLTGTYTAPNGSTTNRTVTVQVIGGSLGLPVAAWAGKWRPWEYTLPAALGVQPDSRLTLTASPGGTNGATRTFLGVEEPDQRFVLARLPGDGAVVDRTRVDGFRLFSGYETKLSVVQKFEDGSELVELRLVMSPVRPRVRVKVEVHAGGIMLDDGTTTRVLNTEDFDELGRASVRFVRAPWFKTSICHRTKAFQDGVLIGTYP